MAKLLPSEQSATTFYSLRVRADEAFGTDEGRILDAVVALLDTRAATAKANLVEFNSANADQMDDSVAHENMDRALGTDSIDYWPELFRHSVAVAVCNADNAGVDLNWTAAARCVY